MAKSQKIEVDDKLITVVKQHDEDFICLTDMVKGEEGNDHIRNWMRNRNTVEFIGLWETLHNSEFKGVEFDTFRKQAGLNSFNLTPKKWIETTNAIGFISKAGRYGGTYAHKDIAFEFGSWISPMFKLLLIKEFHIPTVGNGGYGYQWWRGNFNANETKFPVIWAEGYGGQFLFIVPDLNLVTLFMHHNSEDLEFHHTMAWKEMEEFIIPAAFSH